MANVVDYATTYARFEWETPERFNFGRDVVDKWAAEGDRPAMIWLGTNGEEECLSFADFSRLSNRFANAARSLGVQRGDGVMVSSWARPPSDTPSSPASSSSAPSPSPAPRNSGPATSGSAPNTRGLR